jgi:hypothetical protein
MIRRESTVRLAAGAAVVSFEWAADRWRHVVTVADGVRLTSVEGPAAPADDPRWPASPVLTEVSLVDVGGRPAILGVGRAGRSHFSASVTAHPDLPDTLLFDIACRLHEQPGPLGSTYARADGTTARVAPAADLSARPRPPCTARWTYAVGPAGLAQLPAPAVPSRHP